MEELVKIKSKYETKCGACKKFVGLGWDVYWNKAKKYVVHTTCKDKKVKSKKGANSVFGYASGTGVRHMTPRL